MRYSPSCENRGSEHASRQTADLNYNKCRRRPSARWFLRFSIIFGVFLISTAVLANKGQEVLQENDTQGATQYNSGRSLLSTPDIDNDTSGQNGPVYERCDFEEAHYPYAFVVLYAIIVLIFFIALAIICDDFFVPSLEVISEELNLSEDVAGATFMAAGSSAPELFTSIAGVAFESDVGVGTIVGSAVFNINIIIALTAALAGQVLVLDPRPLIRDSLFYALSIACFIAFAWDGMFVHWEAAVMLCLYGLYILIMKYNTSIMNLTCCKRRDIVPLDEEAIVDGEDAQAKKMKDSSSTLGSFANVVPPGKLGTGSTQMTVPGAEDPHQKHVFHHAKQGELSHHFSPDQQHLQPNRSSSIRRPSMHHHHDHEHGVWYLFVVKGHPATPSKHGADGEQDGKPVDHPEDMQEEEEPELRPLPCLPAINMYYPERDILNERFGCLRLVLKWIFFFISFPFVCMFTWTIPNCGNPKFRKYYVASFCLSVLWIAAISFAMVTLVIRAGCILKVDHYVMGLIIVAVGTSVPDALSSILVARDGFGDMAVSNAIGSNVFDIDLGLGLPYAISIAIRGGKPQMLLSEAQMALYQSGEMLITPHAKFGFILLLILFFALIIFCAVRFRLNKTVGFAFVGIYICFMIYAFIQEFVCDYNC